MYLWEIIETVRVRLELAEVDSPLLSAELLLGHILKKDRLYILVHIKEEFPKNLEADLELLVNRRILGEPVAYLIQNKEFFGRDFFVNKHVLIPRPETEEIIEHVKAFYSSLDAFIFVDFGTGSGNISVSLAKEFPNALGIAVDISLDALFVAKENAQRHNVLEQILFIQADFRKPCVQNEIARLCVSNPPYISEKELLKVSREVSAFEPHGALYSADNGCSHVKELLPYCTALLQQEGVCFIEIAYEQKEELLDYAQGFQELKEQAVLEDLSAHDRFLFFKKK